MLDGVNVTSEYNCFWDVTCSDLDFKDEKSSRISKGKITIIIVIEIINLGQPFLKVTFLKCSFLNTLFLKMCLIFVGSYAKAHMQVQSSKYLARPYF